MLPPSTNQLERMHWAVKKKLREKFTWELLSVLSETPWEPVPKDEIPKMKAAIIVYRGKGMKMLDEDNLAGGMKPLIDAIRDVGLIRNDSPKWFKLDSPRQERDRENSRVEIELTPVSPAENKSNQERSSK